MDPEPTRIVMAQNCIRTEFLALQFANAVVYFPTIHVSFTDGIVYTYAKSRVPSFEDLLKPEVIADITGKMCRLHHINLDLLTNLDRDGIPAKYDGKINVFAWVKLFLDKIPSEVEDTDRNDRFQICIHVTWPSMMRAMK